MQQAFFGSIGGCYGSLRSVFRLLLLQFQVGASKWIEFFQHVLRGFDKFGAFADEAVAAFDQWVVDGTGNGEDFPPLFSGETGSDERTALRRGFDNEDTERKAADDTVATRKIASAHASADRIFGDDSAMRGDTVGKIAVTGGIDTVEASANHGNGVAAAECAFVRSAVDTESEAAGDGQSRLREGFSEGVAGTQSGLAGVAAANDGNLCGGEQCRVALHEK